VGGFNSTNVSVAAGASGSLDIISGATTLLIRTSSSLGFAAVKIFVDANFLLCSLSLIWEGFLQQAQVFPVTIKSIYRNQERN
jgi:hypothetical protein